jgi:hypothetical protein
VSAPRGSALLTLARPRLNGRLAPAVGIRPSSDDPAFQAFGCCALLCLVVPCCACRVPFVPPVDAVGPGGVDISFYSDSIAVAQVPPPPFCGTYPVRPCTLALPRCDHARQQLDVADPLWMFRRRGTPRGCWEVTLQAPMAPPTTLPWAAWAWTRTRPRRAQRQGRRRAPRWCRQAEAPHTTSSPMLKCLRPSHSGLYAGHSVVCVVPGTPSPSHPLSPLPLLCRRNFGPLTPPPNNLLSKPNLNGPANRTHARPGARDHSLRLAESQAIRTLCKQLMSLRHGTR